MDRRGIGRGRQGRGRRGVGCRLSAPILMSRTSSPSPPLPPSVQGCVPIRFRTDKQLISHDTHNNTYNYKYTFSVEIIAVCKVRGEGTGAG